MSLKILENPLPFNAPENFLEKTPKFSPENLSTHGEGVQALSIGRIFLIFKDLIVRFLADPGLNTSNFN